MDYAQRELATAFRHLGVTGGTPAAAEPTFLNPLTARAVASRELGIPTLRWRGVHSAAELDGAAFPARVIAADGTITIAHTATDIPFGGDDLLMETCADSADEYIFLAAKSRDPETGEDVVWFAEPIAYDNTDGSEAAQPAPLPAKLAESGHSIGARIVAALSGDNHGLYWVSLTLDADQLYFSHLGYGPCPAGMLTAYTQRFSQAIIHARAYLGLPVDVTLTTPGASTIVAGSLDLNRALAVPEADAVALTEGEWLVVATGPTVEDAARRVTAATASDDAAHHRG
ncbi:MAG: hypothetical protein SPI77_01370 [Corynebacterium sp.]|nr:hypothetical protein [Corynebacterium sp.]